MDAGFVKSAVRVFELLELYEVEKRPLRVGEIVERLGYPQSSVSTLLRTLVSSGYMEFFPGRREYCPSVRVAFLGDWVAHVDNEREGIQEAMRRLAQESGETVLLGKRTGLRLQYLSVISSAHALRFAPPAGTMRPIHRTAIGIMLLSQLEDAEIALILRRINAESHTGSQPASIGQTFRSIELARSQGYFESDGHSTVGAGVIATLVPTPLRGQRLGIGIGAPVARLHKRRKQYVNTLLEVTKRL